MGPHPGFVDLDDLVHSLLVTHRLLLQFMKKPSVPKVRKILYVICGRPVRVERERFAQTGALSRHLWRYGSKL
jgi:hypothetical protein